MKQIEKSKKNIILSILEYSYVRSSEGKLVDKVKISEVLEELRGNREVTKEELRQFVIYLEQYKKLLNFAFGVRPFKVVDKNFRIILGLAPNEKNYELLKQYMNETIRAIGQLEVENGKKIYFDEILKVKE